MNRSHGVLSLELDPVTANLLVDFARTWGVSEKEAVRRAVEVTSAVDNLAEILDVLESEAFRDAFDSKMKAPLSEREVFLLTRHLEGYKNAEIAQELGEDLRVTRYHWQVVMSKIRYRLRKMVDRPKEPVATPSSRWQAFQELQRRLGLTAAKAAAWQDDVREARR